MKLSRNSKSCPQQNALIGCNNRMHSSAAMCTTVMWSNVIGLYVNVCVRISECQGVCEGYIQVKVTNTTRSLKSIECAKNALEYSPLHSPSHALAACWHTIHCESKLLVLGLELCTIKYDDHCLKKNAFEALLLFLSLGTNLDLA